MVYSYMHMSECQIALTMPSKYYVEVNNAPFLHVKSSLYVILDLLSLFYI